MVENDLVDFGPSKDEAPVDTTGPIVIKKKTRKKRTTKAKVAAKSDVIGGDSAGPAASNGATPIRRMFREHTSFFSDLFKLRVEKMLIWTGWTKISQSAAFDEDGNTLPDWMLVEHCHSYRTVDSKGKMPEYCSPIGGHFHKIKVNRNPKDPTEIYSVECMTGPLKWSVENRYGKRQRIAVPINPFDKHTHEIDYIKSDKISRPTMNVEAIKMMGMQEASNSKTVLDEQGNRLEDLAVR